MMLWELGLMMAGTAAIVAVISPHLIWPEWSTRQVRDKTVWHYILVGLFSLGGLLFAVGLIGFLVRGVLMVFP